MQLLPAQIVLTTHVLLAFALPAEPQHITIFVSADRPKVIPYESTYYIDFHKVEEPEEGLEQFFHALNELGPNVVYRVNSNNTGYTIPSTEIVASGTSKPRIEALPGVKRVVKSMPVPVKEFEKWEPPGGRFAALNSGVVLRNGGVESPR
ncbi:hypothetical protein BJ508DRAFT_307513 [Ascobolus immersus RN42]|uniref:Inhibitor I9 domain-containing protein n=1 Tax=Ascobolus immersus RN42 TaxID=1160509 RepID=A0A3N4I2J3_ASCIM|nr:hypothetical protein BJ508DRAFT_307513 [Ascobolus immersus RN42]